MRVHWADHAKQRLKLIEEEITKYNPTAAKKITAKILKRSQQIGELPYSGRQLLKYKQNEVREILERPYRIIYHIKEDQIDVVAVMHYRQLLPDDIKNL